MNTTLPRLVVNSIATSPASNMLSTLRLAGRPVAARRAASALTFRAARAGSTWANVQQGPPVSSSSANQNTSLCLQLC